MPPHAEQPGIHQPVSTEGLLPTKKALHLGTPKEHDIVQTITAEMTIPPELYSLYHKLGEAETDLKKAQEEGKDTAHLSTLGQERVPQLIRHIRELHNKIEVFFAQQEKNSESPTENTTEKRRPPLEIGSILEDKTIELAEKEHDKETLYIKILAKKNRAALLREKIKFPNLYPHEQTPPDELQKEYDVLTKQEIPFYEEAYKKMFGPLPPLERKEQNKNDRLQAIQQIRRTINKTAEVTPIKPSLPSTLERRPSALQRIVGLFSKKRRAA